MLKYSPEQLDEVFRALADPTRRAILEHLSSGSASVSELAAPLAMSLPAVHQHLRVLEDSGLVQTKKVGRVRTCQIDVTTLDQAQTWMNERRAQWHRRLDRLGTFLAEPDAATTGKTSKPRRRKTT